jgi:hypothetical protein
MSHFARAGQFLIPPLNKTRQTGCSTIHMGRGATGPWLQHHAEHNRPHLSLNPMQNLLKTGSLISLPVIIPPITDDRKNHGEKRNN